MEEYLAIALNLENMAPSQYGDYNFNSMATFNGYPIAAGEAGIFQLDSGDDFNGVSIDSLIETVKTDMGTENLQAIRSINIGYETSDDLTISIITDDVITQSYTLTPEQGSQFQHGNRLSVGSTAIGRYRTYKIENTSGCDFSIDTISVVPIVMNRRYVSRHASAMIDVDVPDFTVALTGS